MKTNTKTLAVSLSLMASTNALAGMGGVNVQSNLGEPFSGSIVVTGKEAEALLQQKTVSVSGGNISGTVVPQGNGNAVIYLRSKGAINEPIVNFVVKAGSQTRQYAAMVNPAQYAEPKSAKRVAKTQTPVVQASPNVVRTPSEVVQTEVSQPATRKVRTRSNRYAAPMVRSANAQYHRVQTGETLAQVAERYRPHNMSLQRAMRAIMAANPRAFRAGTSGNVMYDNATLYIPTDSQFQGYAQGKRFTKRRLSRHRYVAPAAVATSSIDTDVQPEVTVAQTMQIEAKPVETAKPVASEIQPAPVKEQSVVTKVETASVAQPVETTSVAQAAASTVSAVAVQTVAASAASEAVVVTASATNPVAASVASAVEASKPVVVQTETAKPAPMPEPEPESETDWVQMGAIGLAGVAVLGGLGYALSRRRKAAVEEVDEEFEIVDDGNDEFVVDDNVTISPAVAAAQRANLDKQEEDFFDESHLTTAATSKPTDEFDLSSFEPENIQQTSTTITEAEDDFDWLTEVTETADVVAEEVPLDTGKVATGAAFVAMSTQDPVADDFAPNQPEAVVEAKDDESWLDDIFAADTQAVVAETPVQEANDEKSASVFDEFVVEEPVVEAAPVDDLVFEDFTIAEPSESVSEDVATLEPAADVEEHGNVDFNIADVAIADPVSAVAVEQEDALSFDVSELTEPAIENVAELPEAPELATDNVTFDLPETPEQDFDLDLPSIEEPAIATDAPLDVTISEPVESVADETVVANTSVDDASLDFLDGLDEIAEEPMLDAQATAEVSVGSVADDVLSLEEPFVSSDVTTTVADAEDQDVFAFTDDIPATANNNSAGFVSEAVGMTAPQEAKLELAKMYLEIDDAVAARETLRELINESHGELQQQAKDLLAELGG